MSRVDEWIRRDFAGLTHPVPLDGVFERVGRRKARRRVIRRLQSGLLAALVLGGSVTGTVVLTRVFSHHGVVVPGGGPTANPHGGGGRTDVDCYVSMTDVDVDGDGQIDQVAVDSPGISNDDTCAHSNAGQQYELVISGGKYTTESPPFHDTRFYGAGGPLPECAQPLACQLFATPDLNGDEAREVAVQIAKHGPMRRIVLYQWSRHTGMTRVALAPPGDPWSEQYGISAGPGTLGPATLWWGDSPESVRSISCSDRGGLPVVVVTTAVPARGGGYRVHRTYLRLDAGLLTVVGTSDETVAVAPSLPPDLCGAPIWQPGDNPRP